MNIQFKKGVLELLVLALLKEKDRYGYEISESVSKKIDISDGTVYPILRKLKTEGLVNVYVSEDSGGPPRKYYTLTKSGDEEYRKLKGEWNSFVENIFDILEEP